MDTTENAEQLIRRRHSAAFKGQVLAKCFKPEASISRIAVAHGLNSNLVHKWRLLASTPVYAPYFISLLLASSPTVKAPSEDLVIEFHRGALAIKMT